MRFIATVEDENNVVEIAEKLKKLGFSVDEVIWLGGIIIGQLNGRPISQVKIEGVKAVEQEREIKKSRRRT
ncbi:hypothetical protein [Chitinophaga qingshengii]|uniref:Ketohydroxyglutarate aldolase n=1 Tax=Chitinophaga qingshengii TaxID=1569794 RepID=A0ABR7TKU4_9BACT|nr:hypothetical protein [Chitinophaga qingshengii]MBC9930280.1 hypothetical protein [Chitinophaga qingshengii]